jgi:methionine aminotransferase
MQCIPVRISLNDDYTTNCIIENACSTTTAMIIINNPHNPTGKMLTQSDFEALESLLQKYPKLLSSDEVYEYITFEESTYQHTRIKLLNRCVMVSSFGKSFHVTGWKVGYLVAPEYLMKEIKKSTSVSGFQCQQSMPGSNKRVFGCGFG